jgi:DNA-binding CsgD family transcriptional regulator
VPRAALADRKPALSFLPSLFDRLSCGNWVESAKKISEHQRQEIIRLLDEGLPRRAIAEELGVSPGQVSAVAAHLTMQTYAKGVPNRDQTLSINQRSIPGTPLGKGNATPHRLTPSNSGLVVSDAEPTAALRVLIGRDTTEDHDVWWCPSPASNTFNPHLLVVGESGSGKTYAVQCICAELVQQRVPVIVFDYGQGFVAAAVAPEFREYANPVELNAARDGIDINPLSALKMPTNRFPDSAAKRELRRMEDACVVVLPVRIRSLT